MNRLKKAKLEEKSSIKQITGSEKIDKKGQPGEKVSYAKGGPVKKKSSGKAIRGKGCEIK